MLQAFLVDMRELTPDERIAATQIIKCHCAPHSVLAKDPLIHLAFTTLSSETFRALPFPKNCVVTDITGQNILSYYS